LYSEEPNENDLLGSQRVIEGYGDAMDISVSLENSGNEEVFMGSGAAQGFAGIKSVETQ